ncbi:two-component system sensor histidine kinase NtrB [Stenotrophomonas indicatrix]|uniref:two-component system sensor histidine kinase NtrB n=1 Tax=Stenotrophomonas indicatrix TaxID=2045451 RepID=UPI001AA1823B|nr:PAS domain-containing sensor histidine kinase [Stenotrophomonas indicatrix]MBO1746984.1 PAS domain S-box protein [Stenotrophomonas indicatrix]
MTPSPTGDLGDESQQFGLLVNSVTDYAIYMLDPQGVIRTWNPGGERIKGYRRDEVVGTNYSRFYTPEDIAAGVPARNLATAANEGRYAGEGWRLRKDGSKFHASVVIDPVWVDGSLVGFAKITRDVTERYLAQEQLRTAQQELLQAQKLEAIGKLTLGLAHDFNNLLGVVTNCLDLIADQPHGGLSDKYIRTALRSVERGALLTRQLLTFGRGHELSPERFNVRTALSDIHDMLQRCAGDAVVIELDVPTDSPFVELDRGQLEAAILNLVCNSRDAMPTGGCIKITARLQTILQSDGAHEHPGNYLRIEVRDNGQGIAPQDQARMFEPFFTTKTVGRGSGLGLSQVFGFTTQSGGFIRVESAPGSGTSIALHYPVAE